MSDDVKSPQPDEKPVVDEIEAMDFEYECNEWGWGFCHLSDEALSKAGQLHTIRFLDLFEACDRESATDEGLSHIASNRSLVSLRLGPGITDDGLAHIAGLSQLEELRIDSAEDVTDDGMQHLAGMQNLKKLSVQFTQVGDDGARVIARLPKLTELFVEGSAITKKGLAALAKALPGCTIS